MRATLSLVAALCVTGSAVEEPAVIEESSSSSDFSGFVSLGWESNYVSEGRDNLDGDGLLAGTFELAWQSFVFGAWLIDSTGQSYDEMHLNIAYVHEWGDFEFYAQYNHLRFFNDSDHDHELGVGCSWSGAPFGVVCGVDAYNSIDASGTFIEAFAEREFAVCDRLSVTPGIVLGFNQGYAADGHHGANHIAATLGFDCQIVGDLFLEGHASYSWALGREVLRPDDALLRDFGYVGAALRLDF